MLAMLFALVACNEKDDSYKLYFRVNGEVYKEVSLSENKIIQMPENPKKEGYVFDGWYLDEGIWASPFTENWALDNDIKSNVNIYAKWVAVTYNITYLNTEGAENRNRTSYTVEDETFDLIDLEREYYIFDGWYAGATKITEITKGSYGDKILTARWLPNFGDITPISSAKDLAAITLDGNYVLMSDIDLLGAEWVPIGTYTEPFVGVFNGNGFSISNFKIGGNIQYAGLFGYSKGTIQNLGLKNFTINVTSSGESYVGGLVGENSGTISNCYTSGNITVTSNGIACAGGLVGYNSGVVSDCYTAVGVTAVSDTDAYSIAGGLIGWIGKGEITGCYATGAVAASSGYDSYAGGLIGWIEVGVVKRCYATGSVTATSGYTAYIGGLVGGNEEGTLDNCYATGSVTAVSEYVGYAGGFIGTNDGAVSNCYATGVVNDKADFIGVAGGFIGSNNGAISNCYAVGNASVSVSTANFKAEISLGGFIGSNNGTITNCYRYNGQIIATNNNTPANAEGTATPLERLKSVDFYLTVLDWDSNAWNFAEGEYPTLKA